MVPGVSNHRRLDCLLNRLFRHGSNKTSTLPVIGLFEGNSLVVGEFPAQRASNAENIFFWWRHHVSRAPYHRMDFKTSCWCPSLSIINGPGFVSNLVPATAALKADTLAFRAMQKLIARTKSIRAWNFSGYCQLQYVAMNMHTVFALLYIVVVIYGLIFPYPSGLLHWHCGNLTIAPVPAKQPWWIWINTSCKFIMNDCITTTKQSTTKPCAYFLGYTVSSWFSES